MSNNDLTITITIAAGKVSVKREKVATVAPVAAKRSKGMRYVVGSKQHCLDILARRSHGISAARLAAMGGISVGATHNCVYLLRRDGWPIETQNGKYKLVG